jgi:hypothetical protein
VRDEDLALLPRQLVDRQLELMEKDVAGVEGLRSGIGRRQEVFEREPFVVGARFGGRRMTGPGYCRGRPVAEDSAGFRRREELGRGAHGLPGWRVIG